MNQVESAKSPESTERTKMIHLGPPDTPPSVTFCGAVTSKDFPDYVEADCVVCAEIAKSLGYLV
jgi:hypothetical protein